MTYQAVLFDMDGTLLDTLADLGHSANQMLEARNLPTQPLEAYRNFVGAGARNLVIQVLPEEYRDVQTVEACLREYLDIYKHNWNGKTQLYPGIEEMLDYLRKSGYRLAILSNKPQDPTERCTETFLSRWFFEEVWGKKDEYDFKPSPDSALKIAENMGLDPSAFFYLGDTAIDMKTANAAGMYPAGALWGFRSREELQEAGAAVLLEHPMDITQYLD